MRPDRVTWIAAALLLCAVTAAQYFGGAYVADYSGAADEPAHLVTSLMIRDYLALWPLPDPMPWASAYYAHYPKVAIGHWPPLYFAVQALWWLVFPIGRASAMALNVLMAVGAAGFFAALAGRVAGRWLVLAATVLLLAAPVTQEAYGQVMSDLPALLTGLAVVWTAARFVESPTQRRLIEAGVAITAALLTKGTAVALLPGLGVSVLAGAIAGGFRPRTGPVLAAGAALLAVAALWYWKIGSMGSFSLKQWAGASAGTPWYPELVAVVAGPGMVVTAVAGAISAWWTRRPAVWVPAVFLAGMLFTSSIVRAMREPRHWIVAVPLLLLLTLAAISWLPARLRWVTAVFALLLFPFSFYQQHELGFISLRRQLPGPARMLVSSPLGWSEGCWIAAVSLTEPRPSSYVFRATKLLARTDWNAYAYRSYVQTHDDVERILDQSRVDLVVLHDVSPPKPLPHHPLLTATVRTSPSWRPCGAVGQAVAFCRALPPRFPPKPVQIDLRGHTGRVLTEDGSYRP